MESRGRMWGAVVLVVAVVGVGFGFGAGVYIDQAYPDVIPYFAHHSSGRIDTTELQQAIRVIQADYVDANVDTKKLSHGTVQGLISSLGDPFSAYYDPDAYKKLQQVYTGHYSGIGIYLTFTSSYPVITGTVPGSPAASAGLQQGDQILKVGDKDMKGITADQASTLIQGPDGSKVSITVQRGTQTLTVTITRAEIQVPSVRSTTIGDHILYVRIYQFATTTTDEFHTALTSGLPGAKGMVLDLREDPGGFISEADHVISQFVVSGETFELRDRSGHVERHDVTGEHLATSVPLVVLVNANSASSAEIVAGSLQVHHRAKLVGTVTFGKGSVQQDFPLSDGADIHLTVKRWYLPNGQTIDHKGLTPDVSVPLASAALEFDVLQPGQGYAKDAQLNSALSVLSGG